MSDDLERFMAKARRDPVTGCLLWTAARDRKGYGYFKASGRSIRAHRWVFGQAHGGVLPEAVMHRCDTPSCVEIDHLAGGTRALNNADMDAKGRRRPGHGEGHGHAKLTDAEVAEIRAEYALGVLTQAMLGDVYGVSQANIGSIVNRKIRVSHYG